MWLWFPRMLQFQARLGRYYSQSSSDVSLWNHVREFIWTSSNAKGKLKNHPHHPISENQTAEPWNKINSISKPVRWIISYGRGSANQLHAISWRTGLSTQGRISRPGYPGLAVHWLGQYWLGSWIIQTASFPFLWNPCPPTSRIWWILVRAFWNISLPNTASRTNLGPFPKIYNLIKIEFKIKN